MDDCRGRVRPANAVPALPHQQREAMWRRHGYAPCRQEGALVIEAEACRVIDDDSGLALHGRPDRRICRSMLQIAAERGWQPQLVGADPALREAMDLALLTLRQAAAPADYAANRDLGLFLAARRALQIEAEPYLRAALAAGQAAGSEAVRLTTALCDILCLLGRFGDALALLHQAAAALPQAPALVYALGDVLLRLGQTDQASQLWGRAVRIQHAAAREACAARGEPTVHLLMPNLLTLRFFGETAARLDLWVKAQALGLIGPARAVLLAPPGVAANRALLAYWARHVEVIEDPAAIAAMQERYRGNVVFLDYVPIGDGRTLRRDLAHAAVHGAWEAQGRAPLLSLDADHAARGRALLRRQGMPDDAWFVCLHVREPGFHGDEAPWSLNRHRNAGVADYLPAIQAIIKRGGWVVRIGDASMRPLPALPRCIDYAHADWREDWCDLVMIAAARFYLGMPTGPYSVAMAFGVPVLGTNWFPLGFWPFCSGDLLLHKRLVSRRDGRPLSIAESLRPGLMGGLEPAVFDAAGLDIVDNTADEIAEAVEEMLDRLDGRPPADAAAERLHAAYCAAADPQRVGLRTRIALGFLRRHPELAKSGIEGRI